MATNAYIPFAPGYVDNDGPKIVTSRFSYEDSYTLDRYEATGGYKALRAALGRSPAEVVAEVKEAVLLGRGGAGFPAGIKWGFMPPVWPRYLVVNGDESEPGTYKDRLLMERDPHQLIEGCVITCYALGLNTCFLYVRGEMAVAQERVAQALNDAYAAGYVGKGICGSDVDIDVVLTWGAGAYIVGEETALIESLEGNRGMPRLKPPFFPAAKGLYMKPTIVNNVETLSNVPWITEHGAAAFKRHGSEKSPGSRMLAISGHVNRPGVYEVEQGVVTFRELFYGDNFCQGIRDGNELKMFIPGGGSAPWFFDDQLDLPLEASEVGPAGSMLGSGAIVVMDETTDAVAACLRVVRFYARESCGKCTPCREGTSWEEKILERILDGHGRPEDIDLLLDVGSQISPGAYPVASWDAEDLPAVPYPPKQTTICPLGPSSVAPITSAIRRFRPEFEAKIPAGPTAGPQPDADADVGADVDVDVDAEMAPAAGGHQ
ncbi:MAG: NADH-quinone oxidoreductase subunit NuoF [Acidimicrobiales bacterium]